MKELEISDLQKMFTVYITKIAKRCRIKYLCNMPLTIQVVNWRELEKEMKYSLEDDICLIEQNYLNWRLLIENERLSKSLSRLTEFECTVIYMAFVLEFTEREIAKKLNRSKSFINKAKKSSLKKLRSAMENE